MSSKIVFTPPFAPVLEHFQGDYEAYANAYEKYLGLVEKFNSKLPTQPSATPDKPTVTVSVENNTVTVNGVAHKVKDGSTFAVGPEASEKQGRKAGSAEVKATKEKIEYVRRNYPMAGDPQLQELYSIAILEQDKGVLEPDDNVCARFLGDVYTKPAFDLLRAKGRLPKSYRSLYNLREMGKRHLHKRGLKALGTDEVLKLRNGTTGCQLPMNP